MKKIIALLTAGLVLVAALSGCAGKTAQSMDGAAMPQTQTGVQTLSSKSEEQTTLEDNYEFSSEILAEPNDILQFESPQGIREAVHALDDLFATLAKNCAKSGIIETEEPPELLSHIATDLIIHELYVWCSQNGNFCLRERARQYAEVAYHVKPQYRMSPKQRAAL